MAADFRALCAELVDELHAYKVANAQHDDSLVARARAALAAESPPSETLCLLPARYRPMPLPSDLVSRLIAP